MSHDGLTRRKVLKGTVGLGLAAASTSILPRMGRAADDSLKATSGDTVYFRGWEYRTDIVQDNVNRYNKEMNGKIDYQTVTGDYPALMQKDLIAKAKLDLFYANPSQAVRFLEGGWIMPANELAAYDQIVAGMYPNIREAWTTTRRPGRSSMRCSTSCATRARSSPSCRTGSTSGSASPGAMPSR